MLDKICTDFETSKKLKELGVDLPTNFFWFSNASTHVCEYHIDEYIDEELGGLIPAYTLETLTNALPNTITLPKDNKTYNLRLYIEKSYYGHVYGYVGFYDTEPNTKNDATLAAQLLIKLLQDEIITVNEVNNG